MVTSGTAVDTAADPVNVVRLRGRLGAVLERQLPSGDILLSFRLVVDRPDDHGSGARVDTLDCAVVRAPLRRKLARWDAGDMVEVEGSLRRRFFRAAQGAASRYEVEVATLTRVARAAAVAKRGRATMAG
jgi:single-strand DNA-binding protein